MKQTYPRLLVKWKAGWWSIYVRHRSGVKLWPVVQFDHYTAVLVWLKRWRQMNNPARQIMVVQEAQRTPGLRYRRLPGTAWKEGGMSCP